MKIMVHEKLLYNPVSPASSASPEQARMTCILFMRGDTQLNCLHGAVT
jgi:hypothetical protein